MDLHDAVDPECESLAEHFLADEDFTTGESVARHDQHVHDLAVAIQQAVEDWLALHLPADAEAES